MLQRTEEGRIPRARPAMVLALLAAVAAVPACDTSTDDSLPESTGADEEAVERPLEDDISPAPAVEPAVSVSPRGGAPGSEVRIEAVGLPPNQRIRLGAGPVDSEYEIIAETRSDGEGRVDAAVSVPSWAEPGDRFIFVAETPDHETKVLSEPFEVTAPDGDGTGEAEEGGASSRLGD